ncbi:5E5 antigen-like [Lutra lutra]|uniref:5E5 antigen-like n=1 Tax=Lutra lutra TaxID=9657 RepID=UPI001FD169DD|nr:5E5 antigen-like [Lutra lutra]
MVLRVKQQEIRLLEPDYHTCFSQRKEACPSGYSHSKFTGTHPATELSWPRAGPYRSSLSIGYRPAGKHGEAPTAPPGNSCKTPHQPRVKLPAPRGQLRSGTKRGRAWRWCPRGKEAGKNTERKKGEAGRGGAGRGGGGGECLEFRKQKGGIHRLELGEEAGRWHLPVFAQEDTLPGGLPSTACLSGRRSKTSKGASPSHTAECPQGAWRWASRPATYLRDEETECWSRVTLSKIHRADCSVYSYKTYYDVPALISEEKYMEAMGNCSKEICSWRGLQNPLLTSTPAHS